MDSNKLSALKYTLWILFKSTGNICEAKKKQKNETSNDIIGGST
jgi:hypothetical protein